jgi:hypothetical protein
VAVWRKTLGNEMKRGCEVFEEIQSHVRLCQWAWELVHTRVLSVDWLNIRRRFRGKRGGTERLALLTGTFT